MGSIYACIALLVLLVAQVHCATLVLSNTLGSYMVLQRAPQTANIWGWADPGVTVSIPWGSSTLTATAASDGSWLITLPATPAGGPYNIVIATSNGAKTALTDVLFGDVYLCSGQSNMQFTVNLAFNATEEISASNNYPNIRVMSVGTSNYSLVPQQQLINVQLPWTNASSKSIGFGSWTAFSAVCWFTGRDLYDQFQVPIGLISSNWGGTYIQAWSSPVALSKCNVTSSSGPDNNQNTALWNAMIVPFLNQTLKGVVWYQGENNWDQAKLYSCMFPAMINDWRANFAFAQNLPFFFVQLAAWVAGTGTYIPDVRQAQLAALSLPNVGFATAVDLGDVGSPAGSVHPRDKQPVGARLSLAVSNIAYGETDVVWQGPMFVSATPTVSGTTATIAVTWKLFGSGSLVLKNATCPQGCPTDQCSNWAVWSLPDPNIWNETALTNIEINNNVVTIQFDIAEGQPVKGIRYGYAAWPLITLYSEQDLPAIPFETVFSS